MSISLTKQAALAVKRCLERVPGFLMYSPGVMTTNKEGSPMRSKYLHRLAATLMTASLGAGWVSAGNLDQLNYVDVPGGRVSDLRTAPNNATFPANPWNQAPFIELINPALTIPPPTFIRTTGGNPQNSATMIRGFIEAPQTGEYTFWVNGSADAEFWLSPSGASGSAVREAYTDGSTGVGAWAQRLTQRSRAITLTKGQQYYFELIQKSAGVGGASEIGWWLPDFTLERPIPIRYGQRFVFDATCINGFCSGSFVNERSLTAPLFARNPGNNAGAGNTQVFLTENQPYDLTPWVDANYPVAFQWQEMVGYTPANPNVSNPSNLAGEITAARYIQSLSIAQHHQKAFRVTATRSGTTVNSTVVYMNVFADFNPPTIASATAAGNTNGFNVVFSENVNPTTATNKANYSVNNGVVVDRVEMRYGETPNNVVVIYTTGIVPGNSVVTVNNVTDLATTPNAIAANSTADIFLSDGIISYFAYGAISGGDAIGGTAIADLYAQTNRFTSPSMGPTPVVVGGFTVTPSTENRREFPGLPDLRTTRTQMGIPVNVADNYGAMLVGFLIPPQTGNYNIVIAADDQAIVYISPDDVPANKVAYASDPQWNGSGNYLSGDRRTMATTGNSAFIRANFSGTAAAADGSTIILNQSKNTRGGTPLIRGNKYYIEALMKEGGGGDNLDVTWQLPGTWTQGNNNGLANGQAQIPGVYLQQFAAAGQSGPIGILEQPAATETVENRPTTLSVVHGGSPSFIYQWYKNGIVIPDANARQYTLPLPRAADAGDYTVVVRNLFSQDISAEAAVTVAPDLVAPTLVRSVGGSALNTVTIWFDEVVDPVTAVNNANYSIVQTGTANTLQIFGAGTLSAAAPGGFTRVTFVTAPQAQGQNYTVTVNNVKDIAAAGNTIAANSTTSFTGWIVARGFVLYQRYLGIGGTSIAQLLAAPNYPNNPDITQLLPLMEMPANVGDNYGARMTGFFFPDENGAWDMYMASDDQGELWLSTDSNPANVTRVAFEPAWGDRRSWTGTSGGRRAEGENNTRGKNLPVMNMAIGQMRYIEARFNEGGGGDYQDVTATRPGQAAPGNNSVSTLTGQLIGTLVNPDETSFTFTSEPQSVSTGEGTSVQLSVGGSGQTLEDKLRNPPTSASTFWQWQRQAPASTDWVNIAGANGTTYNTPVFGPADNGVKYRATGTIPGLTSTSAEATITVVNDTTAPTITGVSAMPSLDTTFGVQNRVRVFFSEPMNRASIETAGNYAIAQGANPVAISGATASGDNRSVTLTVAALTAGEQYSLTATGLVDPALAANVLDPNPTVRTFTAWTLANGIRRQLYFDIGGGSLNNLTNQAVFPNSPNVDEFTSLFEMPPTNPNRENFGTRITGLITPTETADYHFAISGDDNQAFWLSTDADPANRRMIVAEPQWNGYRNWNTNDRRVGGNGFFPDVTTLPINRSQNTVGATTLTAGVSYYAELLAKEGGGGDSTAVTWWKVGDEMPANDTPAIGVAQVRSYVNPDNSINISAQPQNQTVADGATAMMSVTANTTAPFLGGPISYQWRINGANIDGATGSSVSAVVTTALNGASVDVVLNAPGAPTVTSTAATLTVGVVTPPTLAITKAGNNVVVTFPTTAGHAAQKSTGLPGGFAADATGVDATGTTTITVDVTAGGAADQSYWRTRQP